jgi:hypothetical protein
VNLLQREGYQDLDAVKAESRDEGLKVGLRRAIEDLCELLAITPTPQQGAALGDMSVDALDALRERIKRERRW